ncbi:MAG: autoinducer binding domain-containing protein [Paracoccaceae bacterium]
MSVVLDLHKVEDLSPAGFYVALRLGFAFPVEEINQLPPDWVAHYTKHRFMLSDPIIRWVYSHTGIAEWSELANNDPNGVIRQAKTFGLRHGVVISVFDNNPEGQRSFGYFCRGDRDFEVAEVNALHAFVLQRHREMEPPRNLTQAEIEALVGVKNGKRLKEIAYELGVSEGAVKQRLKNAKSKLSANTSTQAAAIASSYGLI